MRQLLPPGHLIASLLDTALDPALSRAARPPDPERAILDLTINVDPACGAARRRREAGPGGPARRPPRAAAR